MTTYDIEVVYMLQIEARDENEAKEKSYAARALIEETEYADVSSLVRIREAHRTVNQDKTTVLGDMTKEQRLDVFSQYCTGCGAPDPKCQCRNDD